MTKRPYAGKEVSRLSSKEAVRELIGQPRVRKLEKRLKRTRGEAEPSVGLAGRVRIIRMPRVAGKSYDIMVRNE